MSPDQVTKFLSTKDLSNPTNGIHAVNLVLDRIVKKFLNSDGYPEPIIERRQPVTTVRENFDLLLFPTNSAVRSSIHTRYISMNTVLRTQASSIITDVLPKLNEIGISNSLILMPCLCFRKYNASDRLHCDEPHQLDIWQIKSGIPFLGKENLFNLIDTTVRCAIPHGEYQISEIEKDITVSHPYLIKAFKVRTKFHGEMVSVLEGGLINPHFLEHIGIDSSKHSAICLGIMLDRAVMFIKDVDDVRLLRSTDARVCIQMKNLDRYVPISKYPLVKRDISFIASKKTTHGQIENFIRQILGEENATLLEEVRILSETSYDELQETARKRLEMNSGKKNILVRLILRSHFRTLTTEEANALSERVRLALTIRNNLWSS